ncbi:MAG: magnesium transporter CorA family protein [Bacteroidetes bacterium]|nr:magnesium transporter CorA family protein [Bacteroidota bacterium]
MVKYFKKESGEVLEIKSSKENNWINISPPFNPKNLKKVSEAQKIPLDFLIDSLDVDERSRYELEEDVTLVVLKTPFEEESEDNDDTFFKTIPLGLVLKPNLIVTISAYDNPIIEAFINNKVKEFNPSDRNQFVLQIFERTSLSFLQYLKGIDAKRTLLEHDLRSSLQNEKLFNLQSIEKSLVYFVTSIRSNELMMMKLHRTNILEFNEEELDILQDIIVDNSQALEMSNIYTNILKSTMDSFASIISNNLNVVIRRLTTVTIILMIPTLVASFYGMNITHLPFKENPLALAYAIGFSLLLIFGIVWFFRRMRWF